MIKLTNVILPADAGESAYADAAAKKLGISKSRIKNLIVLKKSLDARDKSRLRYVFNFAVEADGEKELLAAGVEAYFPSPAAYVPAGRPSALRPVVVGTGPCGLFCGLQLAHAGYAPLLVERGDCVEERRRRVDGFWSGEALDPDCNVQFGEGGAGTFSDGKLTTGIGDPRCRLVLEEFVRRGAPPQILYESKPHIGTDVLAGVVRSLREEILRLGGEVCFRTKLTGIRVKNGKLNGVTLSGPEGGYFWETDAAVLAIGHSARDTFAMLLESGVPMEQKEFSVGVRIEHLQARVGQAQYGKAWKTLPPADYKLSCHLPDGRGVYTFCMCPGGEVVNASSEDCGAVCNGMSNSLRDGVNANSALLVSVKSGDFASGHPLAGVVFQRKWERAALLSAGAGRLPVQRLADFLAGKQTVGFGEVIPSCRRVASCDLRACLPGFAANSLAQAVPILARRLSGFDCGDAVLTGVETRSSSPVRILRGRDGQSDIAGLYPAGEGAGYAGGIMSAAVDGLRAAEAIMSKQF